MTVKHQYFLIVDADRCSPTAPYLAAGTMAGAIDLSFSATASLEVRFVVRSQDGSKYDICTDCINYNNLSFRITTDSETTNGSHTSTTAGKVTSCPGSGR